jgi:hypothetical protein
LLSTRGLDLRESDKVESEVTKKELYLHGICLYVHNFQVGKYLSTLVLNISLTAFILLIVTLGVLAVGSDTIFSQHLPHLIVSQISQRDSNAMLRYSVITASTLINDCKQHRSAPLLNAGHLRNGY